MSFSRHYRRFVRLYGYTSVRAAELTPSLNNLSQQERARLEELAGLVRGGHRLSVADYNEGAALMRRAVPRHHPRLLLHGGTGDFSVPILQEIYLHETAHLTPRPTPAQWMRTLPASSKAHPILLSQCGENYRALAASRIGLQRKLVGIHSIPAPTARTAEPTREALLRRLVAVPGARRILFSRLGALFNTSGTRAAPQLLAGGWISGDLFGILKGNTSELLGREAILSAMREGTGFGRVLPDNAVLVSGARLRRPGQGAQSFSDVLVGVIDGARWHWYGIGEIKSYTRDAYADAAAQVVNASEVSRLTESFTLVFPRNEVSIVGMDGREIELAADIGFEFDPAVGDAAQVMKPSGTITHLLIAPAGAPRIDLGPTREIAPGSVFAISHPYTAGENEYFTALVLQAAAGADSIEAALARLDALTGHGTPIALGAGEP